MYTPGKMGVKLKYRVRIGEPCTQDWARMGGDARKRYCGECERHVHNFAAMTAREIERLIDDSKSATGEGRICGRIEHTSDGRVVTADLVAIEAGWKGIAMRTPALAGAALTALLSVASGAAAQSVATSKVAPTEQRAGSGAGAQASTSDSEQGSEHVRGRAITVIAPDGSSISGATVTLTKRDDKRTFVIVADDAGRASLNGVPHGDYDIAASAPGFMRNTRFGVPLPENTKIALLLGGVGVLVIDDESRHPIRHFFNKLMTYL